MTKVKSIVMATACVVLIAGCAPKAHEKAENMNNASIGMTKQEVVSAMGQPQSVSANDGVEVLKYKLCVRDGNFWNDWRCRVWDEFYIRLENGKVDSYGKTSEVDLSNLSNNN